MSWTVTYEEKVTTSKGTANLKVVHRGSRCWRATVHIQRTGNCDTADHISLARAKAWAERRAAQLAGDAEYVQPALRLEEAS